MHTETRRSQHRLRKHSLGAAMVEFVVVGPIITILGLAILQYCLMFFAKHQINHASFMAARAGSVAHASIDTINMAYRKALIPLYGGGQSTSELAAAYGKAMADLTPNTLRIEIINPSKESFDDYAKNEELNAQYGARAIPNAGQALQPNLEAVGANSGQSLQDANLLKLRITHGYQPKVWLVGMLYKKYLQWLDTGADSFHTQLIESGRIPIVSHVTLEMQSDAVEQDNGSGGGDSLYASNPGTGNQGHPHDPGDPPITDKPAPHCETMGCSETFTPSDPGSTDGGGSGSGSGNGGGDGNEACIGDNCPVCTV